MEPLTLTYWERRRLQRQLNATHDVRLYRRTLAVLETAQGKSVADVARTLGVTQRSVYYWLETYGQNHDPESLCEGTRSGRPSLWTEESQGFLGTLLGQSPQELGYAAAQWTIPLLQEHLQRTTGQWLSADTVRRELQRQHYVWKRPRYRLDPDPELEKKTAHSPPDPPVAAPERPAGRRRDRSAAVPAPARWLVLAGPTPGGPAERAQCPSSRLRRHEPGDGPALVPGSGGAEGGGLSGVAAAAP